MGEPQAIPFRSADEQAGFALACDMMHRWARQIEQTAPRMRGADIDIPLSLQMENSARFAQALAQALARQAGK